MKISVQEFLDNPNSSIDIYFNEHLINLTSNKNTVGNLTIEKKYYGIYLTGVVTFNSDVTCSRCLKEINRDISVILNEEFIFEHESVPYDKNRQITLEDCTNDITEEDDIDISNIVEQYLIIELTSENPVCPDNCGLIR